MGTAKPKTTGDELANQFYQAVREVSQVPLPGARELPVLCGLNSTPGFTVSQDNVLVQATNLLLESERVFIYGDGVVMQDDFLDGGGKCLRQLRMGSRVESGIESLLANILVCQHGDEQFPMPRWFCKLLLCSDILAKQLPCIRHYARRSVFDQDFVLRGQGWHPDIQVLVHGADIELVLSHEGNTGGTALERLPHHLRRLLENFCFRSEADVANTVALMLTGLLGNHFVEPGKPVGLFDSEQPGLGKTLLSRSIGVVLDNYDPHLIHFTENDEELKKCICATLLEYRQSILIIDNAKVRSGSSVNSPTIESNSMAPEVSLRLLTKNQNLNRPNNFLWVLTMNNTRTSPDLVSRGLPIQLAYEGRPETRTFPGPDPITYARRHRLDILGELAGMVVRWNQHGRPGGSQSHRLHEWARIIGGILQTAGLPEFLENAETAASTFNTQLDELAALAEVVVGSGGPYVDQ